MADTVISALDDTNRRALRKKSLQPCGCLIGLSTDLTGVNASSSYFVPFDAESYDTDSIHDNVTNNTRMTVPSGWSWVTVGAKVYASNINVQDGFRMAVRHYDSSGVLQSGRGLPCQFYANADYTEVCASGGSAPIAVTAGDYFRVELITVDTSISILSSHTSAWMVLLA